MQPFFQHRTAVFSSECILGQVKNLGGSGSETKEMIKEEVVQLVGAYQIFRFLFDVAIFIRGNQFRTDGGVGRFSSINIALPNSLNRFTTSSSCS